MAKILISEQEIRDAVLVYVLEKYHGALGIEWGEFEDFRGEELPERAADLLDWNFYDLIVSGDGLVFERKQEEPMDGEE